MFRPMIDRSVSSNTNRWSTSAIDWPHLFFFPPLLPATISAIKASGAYQCFVVDFNSHFPNPKEQKHLQYIVLTALVLFI